MKKLSFIAMVSLVVISCAGKKEVVTDNRVPLRTDTINICKMGDSLVIHESTCRGCAFEATTNFAISDSLEVIRLVDVITTDNNSPDINGGSIQKDIVLVPLKKGLTTFKLFKFLTPEKTAADSARFTSYKIEVK